MKRAGGLGNTVISEALLIAGFTAFAYLLASVELNEETLMLDIPSSLTVVSFEAFVAAGGFIFVMLALLVVLTKVVMFVNPKMFSSSDGMKTWGLCVGGLMSVAFFVFMFLTKGLVIVIIMFSVTFFLACVAAVFRRSNLERLNMSFTESEGMLSGVIDNAIGFPLMISAWMVGGLMIAAVGVGYLNVKYTVRYPVMKFKQEQVLVSTFGDRMIFKNRKDGEIRVLVMGKDEIPPLVWAEVGSMAVMR